MLEDKDSMAVTLTRAGILIPKERFGASLIAKLRDKLTVSTTGYGGIVKTMQAHYTDRKSQTLVIARAKGFELMDKLGLEVRPSFRDTVKITNDTKFVGELKADQQTLVDYLLSAHFTEQKIQQGRGYCYLQRRAGTGKSYIALALVQKFKGRTLYIVHNIETMGQIRDLAKKLYPGLTIGEWHGKKKTTGDITIANIDILSDPDVLWFRQWEYVVVDEVPEYCTQERSKVFMKIQAPVVLAMSATPDERLDGMDKIAYLHFGKFVKGDDLVTAAPAPNWKVLAICMNYNGPDQFTEKKLSVLDTVCHPLMVNQFSKDPWRTQLIINEVIEMVTLKKTIFIMVDRREYAAMLVRLLITRLPDVGIHVPEDKVKKLLGGSSAKERELISKLAKLNAQICVVTYALAGVGLSFSRYDACIFAHPRRNKFKQFNNRIFRLDGDPTKERRIIYIRDNATTTKDQYSGFKAALRAEHPKAVISERTVDWSIILVDKDTEEECSALVIGSKPKKKVFKN